MLLQSLALLVGEVIHQRHRTAAAAEQLHGNWELTSQTHDSSLKSVFKEVCECKFMSINLFPRTSFLACQSGCRGDDVSVWSYIMAITGN